MAASEILTAIVGVITTALGVLFGRKAERAKVKKAEAEADSINVSTTERAVVIWEKLNEQLHLELDNMRREMSEIKRQNIELHRENVELRLQVESLTREVEELKQVK